MVAWGLGSFESDHDADMISDLEHDIGIRKLEEEIIKRAIGDKALKEAYSCPLDPHFKNDNYRIFLGLHARHCSSDATIAVVRDFLNNGVLASTVASMEAANPHDEMDYEAYSIFPAYKRKGYQYVLCGACTMTLGCSLPASFKAGLKAKYESVGSMRDALKQMKKALCGPDGFEDGLPYVLDLPEGDRGGEGQDDRLYPGSMLLNVPAPGNLF